MDKAQTQEARTLLAMASADAMTQKHGGTRRCLLKLTRVVSLLLESSTAYKSDMDGNVPG